MIVIITVANWGANFILKSQKSNCYLILDRKLRESQWFQVCVRTKMELNQWFLWPLFDCYIETHNQDPCQTMDFFLWNSLLVARTLTWMNEYSFLHSSLQVQTEMRVREREREKSPTKKRHINLTDPSVCRKTYNFHIQNDNCMTNSGRATLRSCEVMYTWKFECCDEMYVCDVFLCWLFAKGNGICRLVH